MFKPEHDDGTMRGAYFLDGLEARAEQAMSARIGAGDTLTHPATNEGPERLTDVGNAARLVRRHGENLRFIPPFKKWLTWQDARWNFDEDGAITRAAKDTALSIYAEAAHCKDSKMAELIATHAARSQAAGRISSMIELTKCEVPAHPGELDRDPWLLGVTNGTINLRTGALREPRREDYITKRAPVQYDPAATAPAFEAFLHRIMDGNVGLIEFIQRAVGYSLTGDTGEQCLFFAHGAGANGKSTLLNVVSEILGDYATQCPAETLMAKQGGGGIPNDIARLRGARFVATSETEEGRRFAESTIKQLTGQDIIVARFLFGEFFEFRPAFKIWLAANHKPVIRGDDLAIWRRIRLIPFDVVIPTAERDQALPAKLRQEHAGILAWAVRGCLEWQRIGLSPPAEVTNATAEYRADMDLVGAWIEACCVISETAKASASALYSNYRRWTENNGAHPISVTKFGLRLVTKGFEKEKNGTISYLGIGLLDTSEGLEAFSYKSPKSPFTSVLTEKVSKPSNPPEQPENREVF